MREERPVGKEEVEWEKGGGGVIGVAGWTTGEMDWVSGEGEGEKREIKE